MLITPALHIADRVLDKFGVLKRPLDATAMIEAACGRTGLNDFGCEGVLEPLQRLLDSTTREAALSTVGRIATRWDVLRFLTNLLKMRYAEKSNPCVHQEVISAPIFITGLPRTGTTFLHRLMMLDPKVRAPRVWETIFPCPSLSRPDRRLVQVSRQLRAFERLAPEFRSLHPLDATSPQECSEITAHVFRSLRFDTNYNVPSYRKWLDTSERETLQAFRFHKRFLQHLQHCSPLDGRQWVLKCPEHVFALDAIRSVYPDARVIFVHRDPVRVLLSIAKLTEVLRRPFTRELNRREIGRQESARWLDGTMRMIAASDHPSFCDPIFHVEHRDLVEKPLITLRRAYAHFGMNMTQDTTVAVQQYTAEKPNGGYGPRDYRFEDHGLDPREEREKFQPYLVRFGITSDSEPQARRAGRNSPLTVVSL